MKRTDLMAIRDKHVRGRRPTKIEQQQMRDEIAANLTGSDIEDAPRIFGDSGGRPMTLAQAVDALMEEIAT